MKLLISSFLLLNLQAVAFGEVNLLNKTNGHYKKIPVYNQGKIGNCYSFAAVNLYDYVRSQNGVALTKSKMTSTLWASVIFKDKTLMGYLQKKTGISFEKQNPLSSGDAINTLAALKHYGSCSRETVRQSILNHFPELKTSKIKITAEEFTGIVHLIDREWNKLYTQGLRKVSNNESIYLGNTKYNFPSARIKVLDRPVWKEKAVPNFNFDLNTQLNNINNNFAVQDNTYVARPYLETIDFDNIVIDSKDPTTTSRDPVKPTTPVTTTSPINFDLGDYKIELQEQYIAKRDNTYVAPEYIGVYKAHHNMAYAYATTTIKESLKKKYGVSFKFVDTLLAAMQTEDGYWSVVKEIVKPCFAKAKKLRKKPILKQRLPYSQNDFIKTVETILGNNKPVAIEYCSEMLSSGEAHGAIKSDECGMHLSVIVGHRYKSGKHQMLIQNSWGKSCGSYSKNWDCYKEQGAVWVDSSTLSSSSYRIVWLTK